MANARILLGFQSDKAIVPFPRLFHTNSDHGFFKAHNLGCVRQFAVGAGVVHGLRKLVGQHLGDLVDRDIVLGGKLPDDPVIPGLTSFQLLGSDLNSFVWLSRVAAVYYFVYFLVVLPILGLTETPLPVPESISAPVLSHPANAPAKAVASPEKRG